MPANLVISDQDLIRQVEVEQRRRGDGTPTRTAVKMLIERLTQISLGAGRTSSPAEGTDQDRAPAELESSV